ncbi:efflux RND transporter periplasmic adaptor subunit [Cesiribacter sp. SM1]|uniref:efflux RND transporter periplasmic adaptor subunit n=1 Tax=Cesiribacter sp. SM1 TaxID=2861196 RepID=UPI001CD319B4|nr:efflux RND transporter periplasmic adaptor subunit [Cesiribacter sp. SM1]
MTIHPMKQLLAFAAAVVLLQACGSAESSTPIPAANAPIPVAVTAIQQEEIVQPIVVSGQFTTDDETTLSFKTGGVVSRVLVKEGDFVKKGQLLATLDLTEINAGVKQAELGLEKAERDFARAENLYKDSVATLEQYQNAQTALSIARQQLTAARFNQGSAEIRAGSNGYVLKKWVNDGQVVGAGAAVLRTNGAGKAQWVFKVGVSDKEWAGLELGDKASILTDASPQKPLQARVVRKSEGADPQTGAFTIELQVEETAGSALASGLFGTATIIPSRKAKVWSIPHEALLDGNANKGFVFITKDNKTARKVPVTIASLDNERVYISSGLEGGGSLITKGSAYLTDNSTITVPK